MAFWLTMLGAGFLLLGARGMARGAMGPIDRVARQKAVEEAIAGTTKTAAPKTAAKQGPVKYYKGGFQPEMSTLEAAMILGCSEKASKEVILERYRSLMKTNHPDRGGSPYLSSKINEAKDFLSRTHVNERNSRA